MDVGRNDPCPCGSGKKYKRCCLEKDMEARQPATPVAPSDSPAAASAPNDDLVLPGQIGDYGAPNLSRRFFDAHPIDNFSAPSLVRNMAIKPEVGSKAAKLVNRLISRGKDEARRIKMAKSAEELVQILKSNPDSINHSLLLDRLLERPDETAPLILAELEHPHENNFIELAVQALYRSKWDVEYELLRLVNQPIAKAYDLSLVCMLLGMIECEEAVKPLWDCFHFFKKKYPRKSYLQGPLIGLTDIKFRRDNPGEISEDLLRHAEQSLRQAGLDVPPPIAETVVKLLFRRRVTRMVRTLCETTGKGENEVVEAVKSFAENLVKFDRNSSNRSQGDKL